MSDEEYRKVFAQKLRHYMDINGKNQMDLMNDLGLSSSTISSWCTGQKLPRIGKIQMLADYFNINKSDLLDEVQGNENPTLDGVYLSFAKEAQDEGIDPTDIRNALNLIKQLRGEK